MSPRRAADRALIGLFLVAVFAVGGMAVVRSPGSMLTAEFRQPAPPPKLNHHVGAIKKFPTACEAFFCDRLPGREQLLTWHADLEVHGFGVSSSEKVILGRDGWLFLDEAKEAGDPKPRDPDEQCRQWLAAFRQRQAWCAARGIDYVLLPPPTAAERLLAELRAGAGLRFVDLESELQRAKTQRQVYFRTDTHWNERGGLIAYRAAGPALGYRPLGEEKFAVVEQQLLGDLNRMLCLSHPARESFEQITVRTPWVRRVTVEAAGDPATEDSVQRIWETGDKHLRRALVFHDSFAKVALLPALAEHFNQLAAVPTLSFDTEAIARYQPDVIVQQFALRRINWHAPVQPADFED